LELSIPIDFGALEYCGVGVMVKGLMSFFQHSITPGPILSITFGVLKNNLFFG
jgi:hypothetical protein